MIANLNIYVALFAYLKLINNAKKMSQKVNEIYSIRSLFKITKFFIFNFPKTC